MIWEVDDGVKEIEGLDEDGRPDPEYAEQLGLQRARFGMRALAAIIETAIFLAILTPFAIWVAPTLVRLARRELDGYGLVQHPNFVFMLIIAIATVVLVLAFALTQGLLHGKKGVSIGKAFTGIRTVNVKTLERPGFWRVTLRTLIYLGSWLLPVIGPALFLVSPLFDSERRGRGWLDLAAATWLVDIRRGLNPYHRKRMRIARKSVQVEPNRERAELPSLSTEADDDAQVYRPRGRASAGVIGSRRPKSAARPEGVVTAAPTPEAKQAAAAPASRAAGAVIVLDDGTRHSVSAPVLLGRNPDSDGADSDGAGLLRVADTTRSVSKTHLRLDPADGGLRIADMHSKNGLRLLRRGQWSRTPAGQSEFVPIGDEVRFGDRSLTLEELR
ncbi:RDD family protein [Agrococcus casei]|uniref:RDD family protein n=1 Tax=Agrococcus casei TaxID=343512 RepID=UPI003F91DF01